MKKRSIIMSPTIYLVLCIFGYTRMTNTWIRVCVFEFVVFLAVIESISHWNFAWLKVTSLTIVRSLFVGKSVISFVMSVPLAIYICASEDSLRTTVECSGKLGQKSWGVSKQENNVGYRNKQVSGAPNGHPAFGRTPAPPAHARLGSISIRKLKPRSTSHPRRVRTKNKE
jgi:hypothetical protein